MISKGEKLTLEQKFTAWSQLPVVLQHQYFEHAFEEYKRCKVRMLEEAEKLDGFRKVLKFREVADDDSWKSWRIAAVDGSFSPTTCERVGARFGVYQVGCMIFEGDRLCDDGEEYLSHYLIQSQCGNPELMAKLLSLYSTKLEREMALRCLKEKNVDLILIDGSFFGFRVGMWIVEDEETDIQGFNIKSLAAQIRDLTKELLNSNKAIGVIKRVRTTALDGWILYKTGDVKRCLDGNDRSILASIMPGKHWFAYDWLFEKAFDYYYLKFCVFLFLDVSDLFYAFFSGSGKINWGPLGSLGFINCLFQN